jgi:cephalosporin hydroxylase
MKMTETLSRRSLPKQLEKIRLRAQKKKTDISDHLETLFVESLNMESRLIVELGVGDGESTFVFERVANLWGAKLVSVDIEDRAHVSGFKDRIFVHSDDISFAAQFPGWCRNQGFEPVIDILFIDTSHLYDHTVAEIRDWFPYLAPRCKVFFHDTNMGEVFVRKDGSTGKGWDNQRGVIRAIEEHLETTFNEKKDFSLEHRGWYIRHKAICNGFMILERGMT